MISRRTRRKIKYAVSAVLTALRGRFLRGAAALVLCLAVLASAMPVSAFADGDIQWTSFEDIPQGYSSGLSYDVVEPDHQPVLIDGNSSNGIYTGYSSVDNNTDISGAYPYVLEVSSGTRDGGGYAENVLYFAVHYTDVNGTKRSAILMPGEDALTNSFEYAGRDHLDEIRGMVKDVFSATVPDISSLKALGSVSSDQIVFTSPEKIASIDQIQIFGKRTQSSSDWACQGMRILEVDDMKGTRMYGWFSKDVYIDYSGTVIAEAVMAPGGGVFRWDNTGGTFNITPDDGQLKDITLVNLDDKNAYEQKYNTTTHVGYEHVSADDHKIVFRIDLADQGGSGFETLATSYAAGSNTKISELDLVEIGALLVRYQDVYGDLRDVSIPIMINALGQVITSLGDVAIAGYAQQGDSICIPAGLPDFASVDSMSVTIGSERAIDDTQIMISSTDPDKQSAMEQRIKASGTDSIDYLCIAVYDDVDVKVGLEGAVLRYDYDAGENNPVSYSAATSIDGLSLAANSSTRISMQGYRSNLTLKPVDRMERYLVTLSTDNVANAGTTGDLQIQFSYTNLLDREIKSPLYNVRDYVESFYGQWPGNVDDFAYCYGLRTGGTVQFIIPLQNVKKFNSVSFKLEGEDEWQFSGVSIAMIKTDGIGTREVEWEELVSSEKDANGQPRFTSHVRYSRDVLTQPVSFTMGNVYAEGETRPDAGSESWVPGSLVQDNDETWEFNGSGDNVSQKESIDWSELIYSMSYEDTLQDLGFTKERVNYKVTVHVAGDKVNSSDDDCGSKNLFYFQLVFENGKSGCTLANQQIEGDAFRTGVDTQFYIPCSQDYGELLSINVIPDDQDSNADIYDKLKIQSIDVEKKTNSYLSPVWTASSAGEDGLGWVGIDYRDEGAMGSTMGASGRSMSEVATSYLITESSYDAKFLVAITTGGYTSSGQTGSATATTYPTYTGGMHMSYSYFDLNGSFKTVSNVDIVSLMDEYAARTTSYTRRTTLEAEQGTVDYAISDPAYNFRGNTTDMFYITVKDISQFVNVSLQLRSDVSTRWNVTDVKIYLVNGVGTRFLNSNGEYDYRYAEGSGPELVAEWTQKDGLTALCNVYRKLQNTSIAEIRNIILDSSKIEISDVGRWTSTVSREPKSKDDTFNLFIYPQAESDESVDPDSYTLKAAVRYRDARNLRQVQSSAGLLRKQYDEDGNLICFYAIGIGGSNVDTVLGVDVETNSLTPIRAPLNYGILQQVRSGVLIESYTLNGIGNADLGDTMNISTASYDKTDQKIQLQLSEDTVAQPLDPEAKELAVAIHFRTDDAAGTELRSKYVYLTDQGYTNIYPNQVIELDMSLGNISEITGVSVVTLGNLVMTIDDILVTDIGTDGTVRSTFSVRGPVVPNKTPLRLGSNGSVSLLQLDLVTAPDSGAVTAGTSGPIKMTLGYYDIYGALRVESYEDIRDFSEGDGFVSGGTDTVRMLVPELSELRWAEFEPVKGAGDTSSAPANWMLSQVTATVGVNGRSVTRSSDELIIEGSPVRVGMAEVFLSAIVKAADAEGEFVSSGGSVSHLLESGKSVDIVTIIYGSSEGLGYKLESYDPTSGATASVRLGVTHSYSDDYLNQTYEAAKASSESAASESEKIAAERVMELASQMLSSSGSFTGDGSVYRFTAPRNYTGRDLYYRLTIYSTELEDVNYTVDITVYPETDQLPDAISVWKTEQTSSTAS